MAQFTVDIPDELLPGLMAELSTLSQSISAEEYFQASAVELIRQRCEAYKVGPCYVGPILPRFNPDGTPYTPNWVDPNAGPENTDTNDPGEVTV